MKVITTNAGQTKKLARALAHKILKEKPKNKASIIGLEGDLGSGKTTFLQGFANGLGIKEKVLSPTFVLIKRFKISSQKEGQKGFKSFYHIDCYRIKKPKEILELGFEKIAADPRNIIAVEWSEKIKKILPLKTLTLRFLFLEQNKRIISWR